MSRVRLLTEVVRLLSVFEGDVDQSVSRQARARQQDHGAGLTKTLNQFSLSKRGVPAKGCEYRAARSLDLVERMRGRLDLGSHARVYSSQAIRLLGHGLSRHQTTERTPGPVCGNVP